MFISKIVAVTECNSKRKKCLTKDILILNRLFRLAVNVLSIQKIFIFIFIKFCKNNKKNNLSLFALIVLLMMKR